MTAFNSSAIPPVPYRMPTTRPGRGAPSSWNPLAIAIMVMAGILGAIWLTQRISFLAFSRSEAFGTIRRGNTYLLYIVGVDVSLRTYWFYAMAAACADLTLLIGAILGLIGLKIGRYIVCAALCWITFCALGDLLALHQRAPNLTAEQTARWLEGTLTMTALCIVSCIALTRKSGV